MWAATTTVLKGVCWLCDAGRTGGPNFEDPDILNVAWVSTTGINNPLPWDDEPGPLLQHLLANQNDLASFYLPDIFHIYHFGVGKDFVASSLIYLIKTAFKKNNMAVGMDAFNARLQAHFLQHKSDRCHFGKTMTFDLLGYSSSKDYPTGHWSKGADTASLCKVVECITGEVLVASADLCDDWILKTILAAATAIGNFFRVVFRSPYKLKPDDAQSAILDVYRFCRLYVLLAHRCLTQKLCLFKVKPKAHMLCHIVRKMWVQYQIDPNSVTNPLAFSTFQGEDFVGKVARISRRVSAKLHGVKIMHRYLVGIEIALEEEVAGWKNEPREQFACCGDGLFRNLTILETPNDQVLLKRPFLKWK